MYHWIIRKKLQTLVGHINSGDFDYVIRQFAVGAEHIFAGSNHALAGRRTSSELISAWYRRLALVFPGMKFKIRRLTVGGPPWDTSAV